MLCLLETLWRVEWDGEVEEKACGEGCQQIATSKTVKSILCVCLGGGKLFLLLRSCPPSFLIKQDVCSKGNGYIGYLLMVSVTNMKQKGIF